MNDKESLQQHLSVFELWRVDNQSHFKKMEALRKRFLHDFPVEKIKRLPIEQYVSGKPNSFCNVLERTLQELGSIRGSNALKFGIYFGRTKSDPVKKYRFSKKYGSDTNKVYDLIKTGILDLLISGEKQDFDAIEKNILSPMFKGKILNTYYPEYYLNIFSEEYLKFYLTKLGILFSDDENVTDLGQKLIDFKKIYPVMKNWSNMEYGEFLWREFGRPAKPGEQHKEILTDDIALPPIHNVKPDEINPKLTDIITKSSTENKSESQKKRKTDYVRQAMRNTTVGRRGEDIVMILEKEFLCRAGRQDLAEKVEQVSEKANGDSYGYDIHSFTTDGEDKFIEVKATTMPFTSNPSFIVTDNEYIHGRDLKEKYYICWIFEAATEKPQYWYIQNPFWMSPQQILIEPKSYTVGFQLEN